MDKIIIKDLEVYSYHGVYSEEKKLGQIFQVSVELSANLDDAGNSDCIDQTIDYKQICDEITIEFTNKSYDLIESAAKAIINLLFERHSAISNIKITIKKPWAPMGHHLKYVAVEMIRSRMIEGNKIIE